MSKEKNVSDTDKQLERIADNLYRIAEQIAELNIHVQRLDISIQETRNMLDHLKARKYWFWWSR